MKGILKKMKTEYNAEVQYYMDLEGETVNLNKFIGKYVRFQFLNEIHCLNCGNITSKSFGQGYCFPCFRIIPETEDCVLRPEMCRAHEGVARDMEFAKSHCLIDHYVYLANTGGIKVGVTRHHQIPTRWIDQGASEAVILAKTPNRYLAGTIEVALKTVMADKTNWRKMLAGIPEPVNLLDEKNRIGELLPFDMQEFLDFGDEITRIKYPVNIYPVKVKSISFDKIPVIEGNLSGIKGQYMIFDDGSVINIRKHGGYLVTVEI